MRVTSIAAALSMALAGCLAPVWTIPPYQSSLYNPDVLQEAAGSDGQVLTVIHGNPFGQPGTAFQVTTLNALYDNHFGEAVEFTTAPNNDEDYRLILLFNQAFLSGTNQSLCRHEGPVANGGVTGGIYVQAAFCVSHRTVSLVQGHADRIAGPDDPQFRAFMGQILAELFPRRPQDPGPNDPRRLGALPQDEPKPTPSG